MQPRPRSNPAPLNPEVERDKATRDIPRATLPAAELTALDVPKGRPASPGEFVRPSDRDPKLDATSPDPRLSENPLARNLREAPVHDLFDARKIRRMTEAARREEEEARRAHEERERLFGSGVP
jgi:hypothetical protein